MLLAAGLGTRLRPLSERCAKALVPVGDRPLLAHILDRLRGAGVERTVVNVHHRPGDVRAFVRRDGRGVEVSEERDLLGTAGGVGRARALLGEGDVLVWNADILAAVDVQGLVRAHAAGAAEATLVVAPRPAGEGNVGVDEAGRIVRLRGERVGPEARGGEFVPVHVLGADLRGRLPERGCLVADVYLPALHAGATLRAFPHDLPWYDVGSIGVYLAANMAWLEGRRLERWVAEGARAEGSVTLDRSILGAGSSTVGEGLLARCVVWPGSVAKAPLADAVVADGLIVRAGIGENR